MAVEWDAQMYGQCITCARRLPVRRALDGHVLCRRCVQAIAPKTPCAFCGFDTEGSKACAGCERRRRAAERR